VIVATQPPQIDLAVLIALKKQQTTPSNSPENVELMGCALIVGNLVNLSVPIVACAGSTGMQLRAKDTSSELQKVSAQLAVNLLPLVFFAKLAMIEIDPITNDVCHDPLESESLNVMERRVAFVTPRLEWSSITEMAITTEPILRCMRPIPIIILAT
jgi:hypothetical protein